MGTSDLLFSQYNPFISSDFKVPQSYENEHFSARMLTVNDVVKDYDAVMTSIDHLQGVFGPRSKWPSKDLTLEQDLIDLGWHQKEFQKRSSFAYTVVRPDESEVIGCIYIYPTSKSDYNAMITMWVRSSVLDEGLDAVLFESVRQWISEEWPFKKVAYPGREITWEEWESISE
ncbi:MAG: GNAT family N-acetyltransferase [Bacteroidetes bacterium]|nr:GNAT family N-acetyltransferase [Bacteroidota bacterium]